METIGEEILVKILVKLPTRDVGRSSCVCRLWRIVVNDPSFRSLHGKASHVVSCSGGGAALAESLLIEEIRNDYIGLEMNIINISSTKPLCRVTDQARSYGPANICNGLILFESCAEYWPVVCNPITGEELKIPPPTEVKSMWNQSYAMGFNPSTGQYKLFFIFFGGIEEDGYMKVCTLGDGGGWRRHPSPLCGTRNDTQSPLLMDGKLYLVTGRPSDIPERILVIDVASEAHCTYLLPEFKGEKVDVHAFDLDGRLCIAECVLDNQQLYFWVMPPLQGRLLVDDKKDTKLGWELLYSFYVDKDVDIYVFDCPRGVWLDDDDDGDGRMLCYRQGGRIYKYNTTTEDKIPPGSFSEWDSRILLPATTPSSDQDGVPEQRWNIYGGYRPSLLSPPLAFPSMSLPQHRDEEEHSNKTLVHAIRCKKSSNKIFSACPPHCAGDQRGAKRIRGGKVKK